ncbi:MAG: hypothetical protein HeimC3_26320 [Candidatus Heimdallarchaeota archaeon LC_3]|nr:MAG: hypothetical protein HeimC3_26320 [Candidatus Heimdallarchaeota archaeon LC_3]
MLKKISNKEKIDEPTSNLDQDNIEKLLNLIKLITEKENKPGVIMTTHDDYIGQFADHCFLLKKGRLFENY